MRNGLPAAFDFTLADSGISDGVSEQVSRLWEFYYQAVEEVARAKLYCSSRQGLRTASQQSSNTLLGMRDKNGGNDSRQRSHGTVRFAESPSDDDQSITSHRQHGTSISDRHDSRSVQTEIDGIRDGARLVGSCETGNGFSTYLTLPVSPRYKPAGFRWNEQLAFRSIGSWQIYYKTCLRIARDVVHRDDELRNSSDSRGDRVPPSGSRVLPEDGKITDEVPVTTSKSETSSDADAGSQTSSDNTVSYGGRQPSQEMVGKSGRTGILVPFSRNIHVAKPSGRVIVYARDESPLSDEEKKQRLRTKRARKKNKQRGLVPSVHRPVYGNAESRRDYQCLRARADSSTDSDYEQLCEYVKEKLWLQMTPDVSFKKKKKQVDAEGVH